MSDREAWRTIERSRHRVTIQPIGATASGPPPVQAACICGWRGPGRPPEKANTWARRDGDKHLAEIAEQHPPLAAGFNDQVVERMEVLRKEHSDDLYPPPLHEAWPYDVCVECEAIRRLQDEIDA